MSAEPRYAHDHCGHCRFLGPAGLTDVYYCPQPSVGIPTIILRDGDEPDAYESGAALYPRLPDELRNLLSQGERERLMRTWARAGGAKLR